MTSYDEISHDSKYIKILDKGFVGLVDSMGSDDAIVQAARVSYGSGTKSLREDRGLIRYLMKNRHTSPLEMCEVKFHIKAPIFVFRQLLRHRTASSNEYSGRYSIMRDEFYVPDVDNIAEQSVTNKQGRGAEVNRGDALAIQKCIEDVGDNSYDIYSAFLGEKSNLSNFELGLSSTFKGIARESARIILPLNVYSELYWKQNLHNIFHLLKLRMDPHAQDEIVELANAIYELLQPLFPNACEAFEDYSLNALTLSRMEKDLLKLLISNNDSYTQLISPKAYLHKLINEAGSNRDFATSVGLSERELSDFIIEWNMTDG